MSQVHGTSGPTAGEKDPYVHSLASTAFSKSGDSGLYDRARPTYPTELVDAIFDGLPRRQDKHHVSDIGSGTGIFTRLLVARSDVGQITAIEPADGMRRDLERNVRPLADKAGIKLDVIKGSFQSVPLPDASADVVTIAQAFHWAHYGGYPEAMQELARVLKPGGRLSLIWNLEDRDAAAWVGQIRDAYEVYEDGTPQYRHMWWKAALDTAPRHELFERETIERHVSREIPTTVQGVVDRVHSKSFVGELSDDKLRPLLAEVKATTERGEGRKWIDQSSGIFAYPYRTDLYVLTRKQ